MFKTTIQANSQFLKCKYLMLCRPGCLNGALRIFTLQLINKLIRSVSIDFLISLLETPASNIKNFKLFYYDIMHLHVVFIILLSISILLLMSFVLTIGLSIFISILEQHHEMERYSIRKY